MTARWVRTARGWSVSLLAGVLTAALHSAAGGSFPVPAGVVLGVLLSGMVSTALVGRTGSLPRLAVAMAAAQLTFHTTFTVFGGTATLRSGTATAAHHAGRDVQLIFSGSPEHSAADHGSAGMLFAHVVAGVLSAVLLTCSERAIGVLKRLAVFTLRRLLDAPRALPLAAVRQAPIGSFVPRPRTALLLGDLSDRAPPTLALP
jgi:hypothetical protein